MIEWSTIVKKIAGVATPAEERAFEKWAAGSAAHRIYYMKARKHFENPAPQEMDGRELDAMIVRFDGDIRRRALRQIRKRTLYRAAAILLIPALLTAAGLYFFHGANADRQLAVQLEGLRLEPGSSRASIVMDNGEVFELDGVGDMVYENRRAGTILTKTAGLVAFRDAGMDAGGGKERINTMFVPRGGEYALELADGTKVWLNSKTTLKFPARFTGATRTVELDGEAYFEVVRDAGKPFIVRTSDSRITVHGTKFNVYAYSEEPLRHTTLCEGSVSVTAQDGEFLLAPGQQVYADGSGPPTLRRVNADLYASWHRGCLLFENETLQNIMLKLSKWYNVEIAFTDEGLKTLHFTGDLKRYERLETILNFIQETCDVGFGVQDGVLVVRYR